MSASTAAPHARSRVEQFVRTYEREVATTLRVLRAFPGEKADLRPHETSRTARELAFLFVVEQQVTLTALTTGHDWSKATPAPPLPPGSIAEIADAFDGAHGEIVRHLRATPEERLPTTVRFFVGPKAIGDVPTFDFLWFMLHDQIHHRGQLSVYLRMAGGRVPSIYGPTADEPWR